MRRRGLSVSDVAEAVDKTGNSVRNWLSDKSAPSDEAAHALADLLGFPERYVRQRFGLYVYDEADVIEVPAVGNVDALLAAAKDLLEQIERMQAQGPPQSSTHRHESGGVG
jgi:transcriptional regulator with XRE-family HTH domain